MFEVQTTLPIGTIIQERYVVEALLGKGGFSAVYLVKDQCDESRLFAIKEFTDSDKQGQDHFTFECNVLQRLNHPALPHIYSVLDDREQHRAYMLMDYVEGPNLEVLRKQQPEKHFSLFQALSIMAPVIDAVTYLHSQDPPIVHCDIKPTNIIVPQAGRTSILVDFNIAKEYELDGTTAAIRHCSPGYSAPEQYSKGTDFRSDIYGLAATLYTLLTGQVPPDGLDRFMHVSEGKPDPLVPISQLLPTLPRTVTDTIQRALAPSRNDRFSTVQQFWQAINVPSPEQKSLPAVVMPSIRTHPATVIKRSFSDISRTALQKIPSTSHTRKPVILLLILLALVLSLATGTALLHYSEGYHSLALTPPTPAHQTNAIPFLPPSRPKGFVPTTAAPGAHQTIATPVTPPTTYPSVPPSGIPSPGITSPPPTATSAYPALGPSYNGTLYSMSYNVLMKIWLTGIQEQQGNISGNFKAAPGLHGSVPFQGTVDTSNHIRFIVTAPGRQNSYLFTGVIQSNGNIAGNYCSLGKNGQCAGDHGVWSVSSAATRRS